MSKGTQVEEKNRDISIFVEFLNKNATEELKEAQTINNDILLTKIKGYGYMFNVRLIWVFQLELSFPKSLILQQFTINMHTM